MMRSKLITRWGIATLMALIYAPIAPAQPTVVLRSTSGFPDASMTGSNPQGLGSYFVNSTEWIKTGIRFTVGQPVCLTGLRGIGTTIGSPPDIGFVWIDIYSSEAAFANAMPVGGDVFTASSSNVILTADTWEDESFPLFPVFHRHLVTIELDARDCPILPPGEYILAVVFDSTTHIWAWLESDIVDGANTDIAHTYWDSEGTYYEWMDGIPPLETGSVAIDVWGVSCEHAADFDMDCDVDGDDFAEFEACMSGPTIPVSAGCEAKDLDNDGDTDMSDFGMFQHCYSGDGNLPDPNCLN